MDSRRRSRGHRSRERGGAARSFAGSLKAAGERRALDFLAELVQALALSTDLRKTLSMALGRIADFMQAEAASMFLVDTVSGLIECRLCVGPVDIVGLKVEVGQRNHRPRGCAEHHADRP